MSTQPMKILVDKNAAANSANAAGARSSLKDFFGSWVTSVAPQLSRTETRRGAIFKHSITAHEMVRVNRATVREGTAHRHWPPDVVAQFLSAEVIARKKK